MKTPITKIEKQTDNRFLNMYHLKFTDRTGDENRDYFYCTRHEDKDILVRTHDMTAQGICIYAVTKEKEPRLVVIHEYRLPVDSYIYSLPAGLIDEGETAGEAAAREMKEETGFDFTEYKGGESFCRNSFLLAPGFSDEPGQAVFGTVDGLDGKPQNESTEWIETMLATKDDVRRILSEEKVSVRAAFLMFNFLNSNPDEPFRLLECR